MSLSRKAIIVALITMSTGSYCLANQDLDREQIQQKILAQLVAGGVESLPKDVRIENIVLDEKIIQEIFAVPLEKQL